MNDSNYNYTNENIRLVDSEFTSYPTLSFPNEADKSTYKNTLFIKTKVQCHVCGIEYSKSTAKSCPLCEMRKQLDDALNVIAAMRNKSDSKVLYTNRDILSYDKADTLQFGQFHGKPIEWIVLDKKIDRVPVLAKHGLEVKSYNTSRKAVVWEKSEIRKYLNGVFFDTCFNEDEKKKIRTSLIMNKDNPIYGTSGGDDTRDKVFLLSINEAKELFDDNEKRKCEASEYARNQNTYTEGRLVKTPGWWLRSPGNYDYYASYVIGYGSVVVGGEDVVLNKLVRPAMWVSG